MSNFQKIDYRDTVSSVLDIARERIEANQFHPYESILANHQTQGRGQYGRQWISVEGNLYAAIHLPNCAPFLNVTAAPAFAAVIAQFLRELGFAVWIKWPNDIVCAQGKLCGILLEERKKHLVAGIGLNIQGHPAQSCLREGATLAATSLSELNPSAAKQLTPQKIWQQFVDTFSSLNLKQFEQNWVQSVNQMLFWRGQCVEINHCGIITRGKLIGIDPTGGVILQTDSSVALCQAGTLQLCRSQVLSIQKDFPAIIV